MLLPTNGCWKPNYIPFPLRDDTKNGCVADYEERGETAVFAGYRAGANYRNRKWEAKDFKKVSLAVFYFY